MVVINRTLIRIGDNIKVSLAKLRISDGVRAVVGVRPAKKGRIIVPNILNTKLLISTLK